MNNRETEAEPSAKRVRLDETISTAPAPIPAPTPAPTKAKLFPQFQTESGLFGSIKDTIGIEAAAEPDVGITEYVDPAVPPFSGIIKHR